MPSVCFYFQVHQPYRLRNVAPFSEAEGSDLFCDVTNSGILWKVARKCYLPTNQKILDLVKRFDGQFKVSYSISGVALEQMKQYAPEVLDSFVALADTGCVEFLAETYYHSLAALRDRDEFAEQVNAHGELIREHFGQTPRVFRNTELIYNDGIGEMIDDLGFRAVMAEGADDILGRRTPNFVFKHPTRDLRILAKNYKLSDDIAFRFSNQGWEEHPLTTSKFAQWLHAHNGNAQVINLFMDYETFGEHQWESTGIFGFLDALPHDVLNSPGWQFQMPSEVVRDVQPYEDLSYWRTTSWADQERDITAWLGNRMQREAFDALHELGEKLRRRNNPAALALWRKLQTSDHFYYMCTKWFSDGDVHAYFSPYEGPYDAFINFMNALDEVRQQILSTSARLQGVHA
jgi:alpha-amylase